jgi:uncharacterized protein YicC (UPF0701 family)
LDKRLQRLEANQQQIHDLQQRVLEALMELAALMQKPDEEGEKLHEVLAQLVTVIGINTATLQDLKSAIAESPKGSA